MTTVLLSAATFLVLGGGGGREEGGKKGLGRTRRLSDLSSDKEGHSNLRALPKITQWIWELQPRKQTDELKGKHSGEAIIK